MSMAGRAGGRYVTPIKSDGTEPDQIGRGKYTLTAGATYYYLLGGGGGVFGSGTITGYTSGAILTSAKIQDTDHPEQDVTNISSTVGEWVTEDPATGFVGADGTGWDTTTTPSVLAVAGTGLGGARFNIAETAAARTRIEVIVGGTGGVFRVSCNWKH